MTVTGNAADDVRVAGGQLLVDSVVDGDLTAAGRDVTLGPRGRILGQGWLTGQTVRVDGVAERELRIAAAEVVIAGEIRQPRRIIAETLDVLPTARILAALFLGILTTAFTVGNVEARLLHAAPIVSRPRQALYLLAGVVTLAILRSLPIVGGAVVFLSVLLGLGALGLWMYRGYTQVPAPSPAR